MTTYLHAQGRLHVFGVDLRDLARLEEFCGMLKVVECTCTGVLTQGSTGATDDIFGVFTRNCYALLQKRVKCLDIIINNACQTVRRPPSYYSMSSDCLNDYS